MSLILAAETLGHLSPNIYNFSHSVLSLKFYSFPKTIPGTLFPHVLEVLFLPTNVDLQVVDLHEFQMQKREE